MKATFTTDNLGVRLNEAERLEFNQYTAAAKKLGLITVKTSKNEFIKMCIREHGRRLQFASRQQTSIESIIIDI
jgi:hypothetical protein